MPTYAKVRTIKMPPPNNPWGKPTVYYYTELRDIEAMLPIVKPTIDETLHNTRHEAEQEATRKGYKIAPTWGEAVAWENLYMDHNNKIYRDKPEYKTEQEQVEQRIADAQAHLDDLFGKQYD